MAIERVDGHVHHPVVAPAQQWPSDPGGQAHGALHHLDAPVHSRPRRVSIRFEEQARVAFEVSVHLGVDPRAGLAVDQLDRQAHAVGHGRRDDTAENGAGREASTLQPEVSQPAPPLLEELYLPDAVPHHLGSRGKEEGPVAIDHTW